MKFGTIVGLFTVLIVCSCVQQKPKSGLLIDNEINRGTGYTDSLGTYYNIRYIPITITNDSTIPIHLQMTFSKEYDFPIAYGGQKFKVIPLPKEWALDGVEITDSLIKELPKYIDKPLLNETLEPDEKYVLAIGTLYSRPANCGVVPNALFLQNKRGLYYACDSLINHDKSTNSKLALELKLDFYPDGITKESCIIIPCGQISYSEL